MNLFLGAVLTFSMYFQGLLGLINHKIEIGVYDPGSAYELIDSVGTELIYITWNENLTEVDSKVNEVLKKDRVALLTAEPWPKMGSNPSRADHVDSISNGYFDKTIDSLCENLKPYEDKLVLRFAHEMELGSLRYPWSGVNPEKFIKAYRHIVDRCKVFLPNSKYMWSPVGELSSSAYYPGDDYVDLIGVSIYSFGEWEIKTIQRKLNFVDIFHNRYENLSKFDKPIYIAEMGVTGTDEYKLEWLTLMQKVLWKYPLLKGVVYFNSIDTPNAWGSNISTPDWGLSPEIFTRIFGK